MKKNNQQATAKVLVWSRHARQRQQQRGFQQLDLMLLQAFGEEVDDGILMSGQAINEARHTLKQMIQRLDHLNGTTIIEEGGTVITTYRADKKRIRRLRAGHVKAA